MDDSTAEQNKANKLKQELNNGQEEWNTLFIINRKQPAVQLGGNERSQRKGDKPLTKHVKPYSTYFP